MPQIRAYRAQRTRKGKSDSLARDGGAGGVQRRPRGHGCRAKQFERATALAKV